MNDFSPTCVQKLFLQSCSQLVLFLDFFLPQFLSLSPLPRNPVPRFHQLMLPCHTMQCILKMDMTIQFSIHVIPYNTIQYHIIQCNKMQSHTAPYNTVLQNTKQYNSMQCKIKPYSIFSQIMCSCNMIQCYAILYNTIQY